MRTALAASGLSLALILISAPSYAEHCSVDGCSISCSDGCAAAIVNGKCVTGCTDGDGNLEDSFWIDLDNVTARAKKSGKGISEILCFKGVKKTRGRSGSKCR